MKTVAYRFILGRLRILGYAFLSVVSGTFRWTIPRADIRALQQATLAHE